MARGSGCVLLKGSIGHSFAFKSFGNTATIEGSLAVEEEPYTGPLLSCSNIVVACYDQMYLSPSLQDTDVKHQEYNHPSTCYA